MSARLHDWLLETWYGETARGLWLQPLAWLFAAIVRTRRALYRGRILRSFRSTRTVIVVGNLTVGGTGKTPFVIWLAQQLAAQGLDVGIASRGYRGAGGAARRLTPDDTAATAGDEPLLLFRRLKRPVAIGARRGEAVRLLEADCDVIVCDDGLQHYALARDIEIVVVDGARPFGNGRLLPAGPLREPPARLSEVDAVVVNGAGFERAGSVRISLVPSAVVALDGRARRTLGDFSGQSVTAIAAIGHPGRFFAMLRAHGLETQERALPDHALLTPGIAGAGSGRPVLMTEKDAVKCTGPGWQDAWFLEVEASVDAVSAKPLLDRIAIAVAARTQGRKHRE
jgi:tetraacyldisaccharide 4'-kinase